MNKRRAPRTGNMKLDRIINDIYKDLNDIIDSVNSSATPEKTSHSGKSGDIRLIKKEKQSYTVEGKFEDGWASIDMTLKEKK